MCCIGADTPRVPQMALQSRFLSAPPIAAVPQIAEFAPAQIFSPQIKAVHTGVAKQASATFVLEAIIEFLSDECRFFMRFAFLLLAINDCSAGLSSRNTCAPNEICAPNHI